MYVKRQELRLQASSVQAVIDVEVLNRKGVRKGSRVKCKASLTAGSHAAQTRRRSHTGDVTTEWA